MSAAGSAGSIGKIFGALQLKKKRHRAWRRWRESSTRLGRGDYSLFANVRVGVAKIDRALRNFCAIARER